MTQHQAETMIFIFKWIAFLFVGLMLFSGCAGFPTLHPSLVTIKLDQQATNIAGHPVYTGVCTVYPEVGQVTACNASFGAGVEAPLDACNGITGVPPTDITALLEYRAEQCAPKPGKK